MKTLLSVFGIVLLTLALGGCYVSKQPLFDRKDAVYPFADGTRYLASARSERFLSISASPHISSGSAKYGPFWLASVNLAMAAS